MKVRNRSLALLALASLAWSCAGASDNDSEKDVGGHAGDVAVRPPPRDATGAGGSAGATASDRLDAGEAAPVHDTGNSPDAPAPPTTSMLPDAGRASDGAASERPGWTLAWSDEFDQPTCPSPNNWAFERGFVRNEEAQWYQPDNASCVDGVLVIEARRENKPNPNYAAGSDDWKRNRPSISYTSTSLKSAGKQAFTYGRFEVRARIDTRAGSWPAFWTVGEGAWPGAGEIDVMEFYNGTVLANVCLPMGSSCDWSSTRQTLASLGGTTWASAFHVWAMEWDAQNIDLLLDEVRVLHIAVAKAIGSAKVNPYLDKPQVMILNQAVGGSNGGDPSHTSFPLRYEVDYVRVYQKSVR